MITFSSGGGRCTMKDSSYIRHLEYCSDREWQGTDFTFTITIQNDILLQSGIKKVDYAGLNSVDIEKYTRLKYRFFYCGK